MAEKSTPRPRSRVHKAVVRPLVKRLGLLLHKQQEHRRLQFAAVGVPAGQIVFLGDSISEFGLWHEWFPEEPVLNRGVGGETSGQVLARLDTAINAPLGVFLLIGTNDLTAVIPEDEVAANVRAILDGIERRAPGTPVWVQSVMPRTTRFRAEIEALNRRYRDLVDAAPGQVRYLDLWPALATSAGTLKPEYSLDALHLNGEGYRAWLEVLRPEIAELQARRTA